MHRKTLERATIGQLKDFIDYAILKVKKEDEDLYNDLEMHLYEKVYGHHFCDWLLEEAVSSLENEDGTRGAHWTLEQTTSVAKNNGIEFVHFNEYDWNYVMNMMYSDYYGSVPNDIAAYIKMAKKFLCDKDAVEGKAIKYYFCIIK